MNVEVWQETFLMSQQYSVEEWKPYRTDQSYSGLIHILSSASLHPPAQLPPTFTSTPPPTPTPLLSPGVSVTIHVLCKFPYFPCGQCFPAQPISKLQSRKWSPQTLAHLVNFSKHGLPCLMIIKSCYFDCRIIQSFTCSRCVICILCSVHLILMYMCKGSRAFLSWLPTNQWGQKFISLGLLWKGRRSSGVANHLFPPQLLIPRMTWGKCWFCFQGLMCI